MEALSDVTRMRLVGGNVALDFVNSRSGPPDGPPDDDVLTGYLDVVAWSRYVGLATEVEAASLRRLARDDPGAADEAFADALRMRECLDEIFRAIAAGESPSRRGLTSLRDAEVEALSNAQFEGSGPYEWSWRRDRSLSRPVRLVVHAAVDLLTAGRLARVKGCGGCRFLFIDESKNRSRRWCSMEDCGTSEKIRRFVARRAGR
ncbi:CGNR zinc finger domain-containing protein [Allorhizocola rhizosphaerae]|uniref:CGNR zinc finger domain-containing protein n=1 Tax=Allorhizocola rhizosphaerae TaxID=1872709 RepID=UPI000E3B9525|nr:ABATE domain-containing protein [Allorhizocola rhizosphaerae]